MGFVGLIFYITSPRIFGDSFLYKDVLYLSLFTITFFLIKTTRKFNYSNLILFSLFTSLSFNLKFFTILIPIIFGLILIIQNFYEKKNNFYLKRYFFYLFLFFVFTFFTWPYLWDNPLKNFINLFFAKDYLISVKVLYSNEFIHNRFLPDSYLFNWIFISSPIFQNLIFIPGFLYCALRSTRRFIKINNFSKYNDLWRSKNEKIDFIVFLTLVSFLMIFIIFNAPFYNGWRLVYFFNFFIVYFGLSFINILYLIFRKKEEIKFLLI